MTGQRSGRFSPRRRKAAIMRRQARTTPPGQGGRMPKHLKRGMDASAIKAADAKVRETVEGILADIEARGETAVRDLSRRFDNWAPQSFKLTPQEVERAIGQMAKRDL